jgi:hypothetical protein
MLFILKTKQIIAKHLQILACLLVVGTIVTPVTALAAPATPPASPGCSAYDPSNPNSGCDLVKEYLQPTLDLISGLVGIVVVISLILGGIQYSAAEGDPQKSAKAKNRIANTIFALIAYFFVYAFLQFLVPGGIFH